MFEISLKKSSVYENEFLLLCYRVVPLQLSLFAELTGEHLPERIENVPRNVDERSVYVRWGKRRRRKNRRKKERKEEDGKKRPLVHPCSATDLRPCHSPSPPRFFSSPAISLNSSSLLSSSSWPAPALTISRIDAVARSSGSSSYR